MHSMSSLSSIASKIVFLSFAHFASLTWDSLLPVRYLSTNSTS